MKGLRRIAFMSAAALAGVLELAGLQARTIARVNAQQARESASGNDKAPPAPSAVRTARTYANVRVGIGRGYPPEGIWVGYMRAGGIHASPKWKIGRRGRSRLEGRS